MASTPAVTDKADTYAALSAQFFRRTGRYLRSIAGDDVDCLTMPTVKPPIILFATANFFVVVVAKDKHLSSREIRKANAIMEELAWLMARRAIVRAM